MDFKLHHYNFIVYIMATKSTDLVFEILSYTVLYYETIQMTNYKILSYSKFHKNKIKFKSFMSNFNYHNKKSLSFTVDFHLFQHEREQKIFKGQKTTTNGHFRE